MGEDVILAEVVEPEPFKSGCSRKRHVGLAASERPVQGDFQMVNGHALGFVHAQGPSQAQWQLRSGRHDLVTCGKPKEA
eukprot:scaffold7506_cov286-Pinguiococcus_pyrenoidosus.AAC.12